MKTKMLPLTVVENGGRFEVRLDGRLIQIRTRSGTLMESVFSTRVAAEGYRAALMGLDKSTPQTPQPGPIVEIEGLWTRKKARIRWSLQTRTCSRKSGGC